MVMILAMGAHIGLDGGYVYLYAHIINTNIAPAENASFRFGPRLSGVRCGSCLVSTQQFTESCLACVPFYFVGGRAMSSRFVRPCLRL